MEAGRLRFYSGKAHLPDVMGPLSKSVRDTVETFKLQTNPRQHEIDPFYAPTSFDHRMFEKVYKNPSSVKVGILVETPFLPVSESVKRAIKMTRKVLTDAGYQVVDAPLTPEHFDQAKRYLLNLMCTAQPGLMADFIQNGERLMP